MAAAHTAILTHESDETLIRIKGHLSLPDGPVLVRQGTQNDGVIFTSSQAAEPVPSVADFIAFRDALPKDEHWTGFMQQRPHNAVRTKPCPFSQNHD